MADKTNFVAPATLERIIPNAFACPVSKSVYLMCNIPTHGRMHRRFHYAEIIHVKSQSQYEGCVITTTEGAYTVYSTFDEIRACLPDNLFLRIRCDEIINIIHIDMMRPNILYVADQHYYVSKEYQDAFFKSFTMVSYKLNPKEPSSYDDSVYVYSGWLYHRVLLSDIQWIDADNNYTIIHLATGDKNIETVFSLNSWESILPSNHFVRICRKKIVNANRISAVGTSAIMVDGTRLKLPRTQKDTLNKFLRFIKRSSLYRQ